MGIKEIIGLKPEEKPTPELKSEEIKANPESTEEKETLAETIANLMITNIETYGYFGVIGAVEEAKLLFRDSVKDVPDESSTEQ